MSVPAAMVYDSADDCAIARAVVHTPRVAFAVKRTKTGEKAIGSDKEATLQLRFPQVAKPERQFAQYLTPTEDYSRQCVGFNYSMPSDTTMAGEMSAECWPKPIKMSGCSASFEPRPYRAGRCLEG